MEKWFAFTAYNAQPAYGFGTVHEADKYVNVLNRDREINQYHYREMSTDETVGLDSGDDTDGFRLDLALDAQADQDEWNRQMI